MRIPGSLKLRRMASRVVRPFVSKAVILMYHRVAEAELDPWSLCVTPKHFQEHLEVLQKYAQPMGLKELNQALRNGKVPDYAAVITFDDGYADNLYNAKPLLESYQIPATFFLATGYVDKKRGFWSDELAQLLLQPGKLPEKLTFTIDGTTHSLELGGAIDYSQEDYQNDKGREPWKSKPGTRLHFYNLVWNILADKPAAAQLRALDEIKAIVGVELIASEADRFLCAEEISTLGQGELVEIGAHTVTHPLLSAHAADYQLQEIEQSKAYLEQLLHRPVTSFAYPYGNYQPTTVSLVEKAGIECACSTVEDVVWKYSNSFLLPRFPVCDWDKEEFAQQLKKWFHE